MASVVTTKNPNIGKSIYPTVVDMARGVTRILRDLDYYPATYESDESSALSRIVIRGCEFDNFASNSYLGICDDPRIIKAMKNALDHYGSGAGASRLTAGTQSIHRQLEERIAAFKHREDAVIFSAGMLVNMGVIPALASSTLRHLIDDTESGLRSATGLFGSVAIFCDEKNHASVIDGCALSIFNLWGGHRSKFHSYRHLDMNHLEQLLQISNREQNIIITDGVFSLHGHVAPLNNIVKLSRQYNAVVYVDDAHGTGVLGPTGRGTAEMFGVDVDIHMGTFSKAFGGSGGFIVGDRDFCDYLRVACRTHMFQTAMAPCTAAGLIVSLDIVEFELWRRERLLENATSVRKELERLGFSTLSSKHHIIPVLVGDEQIAINLYHGLLERGIFAPCYRYPAMDFNEAIIRCNMMATHTEEQLDRLVTALAELGRRYGVI